MSYSFDLPGSTSPPPSPSGLSSSSAALRPVIGAVYDQEIDPATADYIDNDDGTWRETPDSRSIVLCQVELELAASIYTPGDGTRIAERIRTGDPLTTAFVEAELGRALGILEVAGVIASVRVSGRDTNGKQLVDETGRALFELHYTDLATGSPVDEVYGIRG